MEPICKSESEMGIRTNKQRKKLKEKRFKIVFSKEVLFLNFCLVLNQDLDLDLDSRNPDPQQC